MPSVLMKFKTLDVEQKAAKRQKALELDAERALKEEIRAAVLESGKWSEQYDEYGQMFYQHADTGQSAWEQPPAMLYVPPPGRDEMGNKLLDAPPPSNNDDDDDAAEELANWVQETDQWGQVRINIKQGMINLITNSTLSARLASLVTLASLSTELLFKQGNRGDFLGGSGRVRGHS
jgi:hypothetical protein